MCNAICRVSGIKEEDFICQMFYGLSPSIWLFTSSERRKGAYGLKYHCQPSSEKLSQKRRKI